MYEETYHLSLVSDLISSYPLGKRTALLHGQALLAVRQMFMFASGIRLTVRVVSTGGQTQTIICL